MKVTQILYFIELSKLQILFHYVIIHRVIVNENFTSFPEIFAIQGVFHRATHLGKEMPHLMCSKGTGGLGLDWRAQLCTHSLWTPCSKRRSAGPSLAVEEKVIPYTAVPLTTEN